MSANRRLRYGVASATLVLWSTSGGIETPYAREGKDPFGILHVVDLGDGTTTSSSSRQLTGARAQSCPPPPEKPRFVSPTATQPGPTLLDRLQEWIGERPDTVVETVVILLEDTIDVPHLPRPSIEQRQNPAAVDSINRAAQSAVDSITELRASEYDRIAADLAVFGGDVTGTFWIANAVIAQMPIGGIRAIAARPNVLSISPLNESATHTLDVGATVYSLASGRRDMASDPYRLAGGGGATIGLVDQLPDLKHHLLQSRVRVARDCLLGKCPIDPNPTASYCDHGTKTAAVLSGDASVDLNSGVTALPIHAWSVFENGMFHGPVCTLRKDAVLRALEQIRNRADVVVLPFQMQAGAASLHTHAVAVLADKAFKTGAVVIAAVGNGGGKPTVVPGLAHKVIAVGGHVGGASIMTNKGGLTEDGRRKPDILAPANASIEGFPLTFNRSSAATAFAAGAAALVRIWLEKHGGSTDPGQTHAHLILSGQLAADHATTVTDIRFGAGRIRLPTDGRVWWGKVSVKNGEQVGIPLEVPKDSDADAFDIALWWPEGATDPHSDIDAYLIDEEGDTKASGILGGSVFERARFPKSPEPGKWELCIHGFDVEADKAQTVYWAAGALKR